MHLSDLTTTTNSPPSSPLLLPTTNPNSFFNKPEFRSSLRFLARALWLLFLHKVFGGNLFSSLVSSAGTSSTFDDENEDRTSKLFSSNKQQQQQHHVLLEEDTSTLWLCVYSCFYFAIGMLFVSILFYFVSVVFWRDGKRKQGNSSETNENDEKDLSEKGLRPSENTFKQQIHHLASSPLAGWELFPTHIAHLFVYIFADVAVISFASPQALLFVWPCFEAASYLLHELSFRIHQHFQLGRFSVKFLRRALWLRTNNASIVLVVCVCWFGIAVAISEHGIFTFSKSSEENQNDSNTMTQFSAGGFWTFLHSIFLLVVLRAIFINCFFRGSFSEIFDVFGDNYSNNNNNKKDKPNNNQQQILTTPGVLEYLRCGETPSETTQFLIRTSFRSFFLAFIFFATSKFLRVSGSGDDNLFGILKFVVTELFDVPAALRPFGLILFWIVIFAIFFLTLTSSSYQTTIWTVIGCCVQHFEFSCVPYQQQQQQQENSSQQQQQSQNNNNDASSGSDSITPTSIRNLANALANQQRPKKSIATMFKTFAIQAISSFVFLTWFCSAADSNPLLVDSSHQGSRTEQQQQQQGTNMFLSFLWCLFGIPSFMSVVSFTPNSFSRTSTTPCWGESFEKNVRRFIEKRNELLITQQEQQQQNVEHDSTNDSSFSSVVKSIFLDIWRTPHERKLFLFFCCTASFMVVEFAVGTTSNSLGLISDAFHMLVDSSSILIGLIASYASKWKPTKKHPFGFSKYEAVSGMLNGILLIVVSLHICGEAYERVEKYQELHQHQHEHHGDETTTTTMTNRPILSHFKEKQQIRHLHHHHHHHSTDLIMMVQGQNVLPVSIAGLILNVIGVIFFHDFAAVVSSPETEKENENENQQQQETPKVENRSFCCKNCPKHHHHHVVQENTKNNAHEANMKGVFFHILADLLGSVAVVTSSLIISWNPTWYIVDPICAVVVSCLILLASWSLLSSTFESLVS